jgi:3-deoxy-D-manno-octulosonic-acid transferase
MPAYYAAADVALLGGSFAPLGGQNLIEAAACACPVVMGPHTFNFDDAAELAQAQGAALRARDLGQAVALALNTPASSWHQHRAAGLAWVAAHAGAAQRQARVVLQALNAGR